MEMDHLMSVMDLPPVSAVYQKKLVEEMEELGKLRTDLMIAKCQTKNEVIMCPIPRKLTRSRREHNELKAITDLSDSITSMASPPYYAGSPPIRESNPLIRDSLFREQMV
uniref:Uncharacterized protein n=1 Tax=Ananas comosus var. bracteatus TaxID=296719 RepID=A0A6V7PMZ7_ANACO|nr:unnamed protein product [Ananas comosus var. bracteatus]